MKGLIFNIKRYAIHDGPGIRVTFFMKGCPLKCWWCHNPEGISPVKEIVERIDRIGTKEFSVDELVGKEYTVSELIDITRRDNVFIEESNGGVTFSGGEPLMQAHFLEDSLRAFKAEGYHTAVDTSAGTDRSIIEKILPYTDLFLIDIKHMDDNKHIEYTGASNKQILDNYKYILSSGKDIILRIPVIPSFNDDKGHLQLLRDYIRSNSGSNLKRIDLLAYHKTGSSKYSKFNIRNRMEGIEQASALVMNQIKEYLAGVGVKIKIGG